MPVSAGFTVSVSETGKIFVTPGGLWVRAPAGMVFVLVVVVLEMVSGARTVIVIVQVPTAGKGADRAGTVPFVKETVLGFTDGGVVPVVTVPPQVDASVPGTISNPGKLLSTTSVMLTPE